jgi:hypothetical protein
MLCTSLSLASSDRWLRSIFNYNGGVATFNPTTISSTFHWFQTTLHRRQIATSKGTDAKSVHNWKFNERLITRVNSWDVCVIPFRINSSQFLSKYSTIITHGSTHSSVVFLYLCFFQEALSISNFTASKVMMISPQYWVHRRKRLDLNLKYNFGTCLEGLRRTTTVL